LEELDKVFKEENYSKKIRPMTLEASVVRLSDIIAYIGRDIEDAIIVGSIKREDIPEKIVKTLGNTNQQIVNNLIMNIIKNSIGKPYLKFSDDIFESLIELKKWNYEKIYSSKEAVMNQDILEKAFEELYYVYLEKVDKKEALRKTDENLYEFVEMSSNEYKKNTSNKRMIIDYISGQTDKFFLKECRKNLINFEL